MELQGKRRQTKTIKKSVVTKSTRRVRVGWKHQISENKYKVMSTKEGGGQQIIDLQKEISLKKACEEILDIYFPNGRSLNLNLSDLNYHLATFTDERITGKDLTVGQYFENVQSHPVRWYLHTSIKVYISIYFCEYLHFSKSMLIIKE
jgi:hypothetical protein